MQFRGKKPAGAHIKPGAYVLHAPSRVFRGFHELKQKGYGAVDIFLQRINERFFIPRDK